MTTDLRKLVEKRAQHARKEREAIDELDVLIEWLAAVEARNAWATFGGAHRARFGGNVMRYITRAVAEYVEDEIERIERGAS